MEREYDGASRPVYEIRLAGHLDGDWSDWFDGLAITAVAGGQTILHGPIADQTALFGILKKIHNLGLTLLFLQRVEQDSQPQSRAEL